MTVIYIYLKLVVGCLTRAKTVQGIFASLLVLETSTLQFLEYTSAVFQMMWVLHIYRQQKLPVLSMCFAYKTKPEPKLEVFAKLL